MRKLCPNYDREDGLETVLEVPMPEELFYSDNNNSKIGAWQSVKSSFLRSPPETSNLTALLGGRDAEINMLLGVAGAPVIPLPICLDHHDDELDHPITKTIKNMSIEAAMAKYIVKQYIAASGGETVMAAAENMYAIGKVKMGVTEFCAGASSLGGRRRKKKMARIKKVNGINGGEMGGFVLWKKGSEQWSLELVVLGFKISAGCHGNVAWRQTPWNTHSHASNGPSAPLRRFLQGLDPKTAASLFARSVCVGEETVNGEECFVLKLETQPSTLGAKTRNHVDMVKHTIWGCFSQRTGLLVKLEDTYALKIQTGPDHDGAVLCETRTETVIQDYRTVDGVQIAHAGKTRVSLFRLDESSEQHSKTTVEEAWEIEEVGFDVKGLSSDCFLPPGELQTETEAETEAEEEDNGFTVGDYTTMLPLKLCNGFSKLKSSKVTAIEDYDVYLR